MPDGVLRRLVRVGFWIALATATTAALLPKGPPMPFRVSDILLHASAFTVLTAALGLAYYAPARWAMPVRWMILYGLALEVVQSFIPDRSAEIKDLVVDVAGIALGIALWRGVLDPVVERFVTSRMTRE